MTTETCEVCGFEWDAIAHRDVAPRLHAALPGYVAALSSDAATLHRRPEPSVWSVVEYCGHVRDVLLSLRDRLVVGVAEDHPTPKPMHQGTRTELAMYDADTPADLVLELTVAVGLFVKTCAVLDDALLERTLVYGWPHQSDRTLRWVAAQALHEVEHHLDDVRTVAAAVTEEPGLSS